MSNRGALALLGTAVLLGMVGSACGATDNGGALGPSRNPSGTTVPAGTLHARLPAALARANALHVGVQPGNAPYVSAGSDGQSVGLDVDLLREIGRVLGVSVTFTAEAPAALGGGLVSHQIDVIAGGFTDTASARAARAHFVDYLRGASAVLVRQGDPAHVNGIGDLCGRRVGVVDPMAQASARAAAVCAATPRKPMFVGPLSPAALAAELGTGQLDAVLEDSLMASYAAQASVPPAELTVLDGTAYPVLHGFALLDAALAPALQAALQAMTSDGSYGRILARWGAQGGTLTAPVFDGGT